MTWSIALRPEAQAEFDEAVDWYELKRPGLGLEFIAEIQSTLDRIAIAPKRLPVVFEGARLALVRRFPYQVLFQIEVDRVVVLAVFHHRRNPADWRNRI